MKEAFIRLALACGVIKFGDFTLKSGRKSPYFFNAGLFYQGHALHQIGQFYAQTILDHQLEATHLFGPAYKGLPLATATAIALAEKNVDVTVTFNRKEAKDHGEGGQLIGAPLTGKTIIIDDVITAGTAFRESRDLIRQEGAEISAVVILFDRCERGQGTQSTLHEIESQGIQVCSVANFFDLLAYLEAQNASEWLEKMRAYQAEYGVCV